MFQLGDNINVVSIRR